MRRFSCPSVLDYFEGRQDGGVGHAVNWDKLEMQDAAAVGL